MFKYEEDGEEEVSGSMQVVYGIGWKDHDSQQKPDERGSAGKKIGENVVVEQS